MSHPHICPEIDIPAGVRLEVDGWGLKKLTCVLKGRTVCYAAGLGHVAKSCQVRVYAPPPLLGEAERVARALRALGWRWACSAPEPKEVDLDGR